MLALDLASSSAMCDTIPAARLASDVENDHAQLSLHSSSSTFDIPPIDRLEPHTHHPPYLAVSSHVSDHPAQQPPPRKLCVRHQRMADEGTNLKLQQALDRLPVEDREAINAVWANFSASSHPRRALILQGLLTMCCFSQLSLLTEQLAALIRLDPFRVFPREVALKVLTHLDATSLCRAAQVSRMWHSLADDDVLWRGICEQHIGQKCHKCGWGLPVLERRRAALIASHSHTHSPSPLPSRPGSALPTIRKHDADEPLPGQPPLKRQRSETPAVACSSSLSSPPALPPRMESPFPAPSVSPPPCTADAIRQAKTRPWKDVYSERWRIERNWRRGRCKVRTLKGHADGVMCLQYSDTLPHPAFPVLITGSYDRTARVWNLETGAEVRCLRGHTRAVRALQFDEATLITGSMDHTMRVWDWRTGRCLRTLEGHTKGVVSLNFDRDVLASGSVDATVKIWSFRTGQCFTLRGHKDWVNAVTLWDLAGAQDVAATYDLDVIKIDSSSRGSPQPSNVCVGPGKMLFSASDDGTIRLWDLFHRSCVRQFMGHVGQVQSIRLSLPDRDQSSRARSPVNDPTVTPTDENEEKHPALASKPMLISGSLDNTLKVWDIATGKALETLFGHIEGVWAVTSDKQRFVSASQDRTVKVWQREAGKCSVTLVGHEGAVTCLALGEDKIVSGSDDGTVKIWSFVD